MSPAKPQKFIVYLRVSTAKQGRSGLGLEAQQQAVTDYLAGVPGAKVVSTCKEIESGKNSERPKLLEALHMCKLTGSRLLIAKLDRLSREIAFITTLQTGKVKFVCADMSDANDLTIHVIAAIAQHERKMISERTTAALAAAKRRGKVLGNPNGARALRRAAKGNAAAMAAVQARADGFAKDVMPIVASIQDAGVTTLQGLLELNNRGIETPRGTGRWYAGTVKSCSGKAGVRLSGGGTSTCPRGVAPAAAG